MILAAGCGSSASPAPTTEKPSAAAPIGALDLARPHNKTIDMAARMQWNANFGYCGETSFISAGMYIGGQYTSQWTARSLASPGVSQTDESSQLLLGQAGGSNELSAAHAMKLSAARINHPSTQNFLQAVKSEFLAGKVVIIGLYNNVNMLGETGNGDPDYDHIVPVVEFGSNHPLTGTDAQTYYPDDTITVSDNGLYTPNPDSAPNVPGNTPNNPAGSALYTYGVEAFPKSRSQANEGQSVSNLYSLSLETEKFGAAVSGIQAGIAVPVRLTSDVNNEGFHNGGANGLMPSAPPALIPNINLTAKADLETGVAYKAYVYDDFDVPTTDFNSPVNAAKAISVIAIPAGAPRAWSTTLTNIPSNATRVVRVVPQ